jgi:Cu+-exporting ATPase
VLATGDNAAAARAIAGPLGITEIHARQSPAAKASLVRGLQAAGKRVAVLGDGVNDAPAFAVADLSLAMGGGADAAVATAAIGLLRDDPRLAASAIRIGRATAAKVRQNLALAFGYNLVAIPLAMAGALSPSVAGAAMAASSMLVVLNALLLRGAR